MRDERGGHVTVVGVVDGGANLSHRPVPVAPTAAARDAALRGPETNIFFIWPFGIFFKWLSRPGQGRTWNLQVFVYFLSQP